MRFPKKTGGETKVHKTLTMTVSFWALVEQIRSAQRLDTADEAIYVSVLQLARKIGIEAWLGSAGSVNYVKKFILRPLQDWKNI